MRIKFTQAIAGPHWCYRAREVHDLPEAVAKQYIAIGIAVALPDERPPEQAAVLEDDSRAVLPGHPPRRRGRILGAGYDDER